MILKALIFVPVKDAIVSSNVLVVRASSVSANTSETVDGWLNEIGF